MVIPIRQYLALLVLLVAAGCNIEVGNPETGDAALTAGSLQKLSFYMSSTVPCGDTRVPCAAAPVVLGDTQNGALTYEMTMVELSLGAIELKPFSEEQTAANLDLLSGAWVALQKTRSSGDITAIGLRFSGGAQKSLRISGNLVGDYAGNRFSLPLEISYQRDFSGESVVTSTDGVIEGITFDTAMWFDFAPSSSGPNLLKSLTEGACRIWETSSCVHYRENLAFQISQRISRSMSVKTSPRNGKATGKNQNPG